jgi:hypothetical protein
MVSHRRDWHFSLHATRKNKTRAGQQPRPLRRPHLSSYRCASAQSSTQVSNTPRRGSHRFAQLPGPNHQPKRYADRRPHGGRRMTPVFEYRWLNFSPCHRAPRHSMDIKIIVFPPHPKCLQFLLLTDSQVMMLCLYSSRGKKTKKNSYLRQKYILPMTAMTDSPTKRVTSFNSRCLIPFQLLNGCLRRNISVFFISD